MTLANILMYINAVTLILPLIEKIVTMVEGLFSKLGPGQGVAKKEVATDVAKAALSGAGLALPDEVVSNLIESVVSAKKLTGEFVTAVPRAPPESGVSSHSES